MDAGAASFRFNFAADDAPDAAPEALPPPPTDDAASSAPGREVFPLTTVRVARFGMRRNAPRCTADARPLQSPLGRFGWCAEEVPIGADGFSLLKARRLHMWPLCCCHPAAALTHRARQADGKMVSAAAAALAGGVAATDLIPGRYEGTRFRCPLQRVSSADMPPSQAA
jgi:hypothetical protein